MRRWMRGCVLAAMACGIGVPAVRAQADPGRLTVKVDQPGVKISPRLYGLMTEEINHAYDGGLYAELVRNRVFQDDRTTPVHWSVVQDGGGVGSIVLDSSSPLNDALPTSLKLSIPTVSGAQREEHPIHIEE